MSNKKIIISAIKEMNIEKLEELLDDDRSYMDVPKKLFLSKLKIEFDDSKKAGMNCFERVIPGFCGSCNNGCKGFSFLTKENRSLDLFIEEDKDEVTDIYICNDLKTEEQSLSNRNFHFSFYEDEKTAFKPSIDFLIKKQKIELALLEFEQFKNRFVLIEEVGSWRDKHLDLIESFELFTYIVNDKYLEFNPFKNLCSDIRCIINHLDNQAFAVQALLEYQTIDNEEELVYWLFTNSKSSICYYDFEHLKGWKKNGLVVLKEYPSMVIDCSSYLEALHVSFLYSKNYDELLKKYKPTKEQHKQSDQVIEYSLESHLRCYGLYLDIIPEI